MDNFSVIRECYDLLDKAEAEARAKPNVMPVFLMGLPVIIEQYGGFCIFDKIRLLVWGREIYRIERDGQTRYEYFFRVVRRTYQRNQFSFCEYCDIIRARNQIPKAEEMVSAVGLDADVAEIYEQYARRILKR